MAKEKTYTIIKHSYRGWTKEVKGTISELIEYFGTTLSYWKKPNPKNIDALIKALNHCANIRFACCYNRDFYELG